MQGRRGGRDIGPAATSHSALVAGRGSYSSPLLRWAFWPLRVEGGPPVSCHQPHLSGPRRKECDRLDTLRYSHTCTLPPDDPQNSSSNFDSGLRAHRSASKPSFGLKKQLSRNCFEILKFGSTHTLPDFLDAHARTHTRTHYTRPLLTHTHTHKNTQRHFALRRERARAK